MCMWTKSYLINLHCVYIYIYIYLYILHIIYTYLIVALFSDDWLLPFDDNITFFTPGRVSIVSYDITFSIYYFIYVTRVQQFEKKRNKIDVLSEEPYPLRRGGATGRADRLMMYDDREMTMHAMGPP